MEELGEWTGQGLRQRSVERPPLEGDSAAEEPEAAEDATPEAGVGHRAGWQGKGSGDPGEGEVEEEGRGGPREQGEAGDGIAEAPVPRDADGGPGHGDPVCVVEPEVEEEAVRSGVGDPGEGMPGRHPAPAWDRRPGKGPGGG